MRLIPKARPIRIRISSGGMEHSTLDSLRKHFSISDVMPMIEDGRLVRWLIQRGENNIAKQIESSEEKTDISVLKIFIPELQTCTTEEDMIVKMHFLKLYHDAAYLFDKYFAKDAHMVKKFYKMGICLDWNWEGIMLDLTETDADIALMYAQEAVNGKIQTTPSVAQFALENAIRLGSRKAVEFQQSHEWIEYVHFVDRFRNVDVDKMRMIVDQVYRDGFTLLHLSNDDEKSIADFALKCLWIKQNYSKLSYQNLIVEYKKYKREAGPSSIIAPEIAFVECMIEESCHGSSNVLSYNAKFYDQLKVDYPKLISCIDLYLSKNSVSRMKFVNRLAFVLNHIFDKNTEV